MPFITSILSINSTPSTALVSHVTSLRTAWLWPNEICFAVLLDVNIYFTALKWWQWIKFLYNFIFNRLTSWLQILRSRFDSRRYQIFWEVVGLEWGPLSLVSTIEELLEGKSSGSGLENRDYSHRDPPCWLCDTPLSAKVSTNFVNKRRSLGRYSFSRTT
jgi:hypothetical protein